MKQHNQKHIHFKAIDCKNITDYFRKNGNMMDFELFEYNLIDIEN